MKNIDPYLVVDLLNQMYQDDPEVIELLIEARVSCNEKLAGHPTVQVHVGEDLKEEGGKFYSVGLLGIINGLVGVKDNGWGYIVANYDEDDKLLGFFVSDDLEDGYSNSLWVTSINSDINLNIDPEMAKSFNEFIKTEDGHKDLRDLIQKSKLKVKNDFKDFYKNSINNDNSIISPEMRRQFTENLKSPEVQEKLQELKKKSEIALRELKKACQVDPELMLKRITI